MKRQPQYQAPLSQWPISMTVCHSREIGSSEYLLTQVCNYSATPNYRHLCGDGFNLGLGFRRAMPWRSLAFHLCRRSYYCQFLDLIGSTSYIDLSVTC